LIGKFPQIGGRRRSERRGTTPRRQPIGVRRPRLVLGAAISVLVVLGALGIGVEQKLKSTTLEVSGTESTRGNEMLREHFGDSAPFAILLQGPAVDIDRQGPQLITALRRDPKVTTISPWDRGAGLQHLRPNGRTALILADFHVSLSEASSTTVPRVKQVLQSHISSPVKARSASYASVSRAIQNESVAVAQRGEVIVTPILLIVLLLVFRSPIAAAIPLAFGATTVIAARGLMSIATGFVDVSAFSLSIASMIGLALGVDYALLIVSRFREELATGAGPAEAASITRRTAGRTTIFAGSTLLISILIAVFLVPGALLVSLCSTVVAVVLLSVAGPWIVGPAILVLVGRNVDRWQIGKRRPARTRWLAISWGALRRPYLAAAVSCLLLLFVAAPALSFATGPLTVEELSSDDPARLDVEAIEAVVGGGWISPSIVVATSDDGPITQPDRLNALSQWQTAIAQDRGVEAVIGPGPLVKRVAPLQRAGRGLLGAKGAQAGVARLTTSLGRASTGLTRLRRGLGRASEGAHALTAGSGRALLGATLLAHGLSLASSGGGRANQELGRFSRGAHRLARGQRSALLGSSLLAFSANDLGYEVGRHVLPQAKGLEKELIQAEAALPVSEGAAEEIVEKLETAWRELGAMSVDANDPHYLAVTAAVRDALTAASGADPVSSAPYAPGYDGLADELSTLGDLLHEGAVDADQLHKRLVGVQEDIALLRKLAARLSTGIRRLEGGSEQLAGGSDRIVHGAARLGAGLTRLNGGARRLAAGLSRLRGGNAALERGLSFAFRRTRPLVSGAREARIRISSNRRRFRRNSPGFFDSGYFVLSALDGAPPRERDLAGQAFDLDNGGQAAQILVISSHSLDGPGGISLNDRLRKSARALARESDTQVAVTGGVAQTTDYTDATGARLPSLVIVITLVTFLVMIAILRALPLAAIAVVLNLVTVAAAFGVLSLLTLLPEGWPLGGTSHIDPVGAAGIFGVVFGLSIDYAVFLLMRMRESWERDADHNAAIAYGLERTASVITGAATIMAVVFGVLSTAPIDTVAQFGIGLTTAIMLDATVIRLMLLPVLMKLIGPRVWWLPAGLSRRLRRLDVGG
jgi:RND superfamily putative drug exporter